MAYRHAFRGAQVASEATFHTAVAATAINNLAKTFRFSFLRAYQMRICLQNTVHCMTMSGLEVKNSPSGKGTRM